MVTSAATTLGFCKACTSSAPFDLAAVTAASSALRSLGIGGTPTTTTTINGTTVIVKDETKTPSGSYRTRPAAFSLLVAKAAGSARGVGASTGNYAAALGYAADQLGMGVDIFVPKGTPSGKINNIIKHGSVTLHFEGNTFDEARAAGKAYADSNSSLPFFEPFDSTEAMLGNATIGLELADLKPYLVVSSIGGGGLLAGIGLGLEAAGETPRLVAVGSVNAPAAVTTINSGNYSESSTVPGIAEAIRVAKPGVLTTRELIRLGASGVLVTDEEIERAMAFLWFQCGIKAEGGGAAAFAAVLAGKVKPIGTTVVIVSGGNIDSDRFERNVGKYGGEFAAADKELLS